MALYHYKVDKITKCVDGDTIDCIPNLGFGVCLHGEHGRGIRVRLCNIDTPESRTRDSVEKEYGLLAKKFVIEFFKSAKEVLLHTTEKGKYGRYLGDFKVGNKWLTKELIKAHLAVPYHGQSKKEIQKLHIANRSKVQMPGKHYGKGKGYMGAPQKPKKAVKRKPRIVRRP